MVTASARLSKAVSIPDSDFAEPVRSSVQEVEPFGSATAKAKKKVE